ncbi:MAG: hypothetical protein JO140_01945 [Candidatus Eremiobacteraeota bacterium]|nr:hypothetical protein [Candidatus Eremiobacteraeota bacterium]
MIVSDLALQSHSWRYPIFTVSSRRMWEPGFLAERLPWLSVLRTVNLGWLFSALGMQPIENELHARPFASIGFALLERHGELPLEGVFKERARARLPEAMRTLGELLQPEHFRVARSTVTLSDLRDPYGKEMLAITREELESDIAHFENLQRAGATIFLMPEGTYSGDGKMLRFRGILSRLAPLSKAWVIGISYDPFVGRRLSMLYRVAEAGGDEPLVLQIKRARPVTTSALLCAWIRGENVSACTPEQAEAAVRSALAALPPELFVDPELKANPGRMVRAAVAGMERLGAMRRDGTAFRVVQDAPHPQFPRTTDMVTYQDNFHRETLEGVRR